MQVSKSDAGSYKCQAENGVDAAIEAQFQLQVSGREKPKFGVSFLFCPPLGLLCTNCSKWGAFEVQDIFVRLSTCIRRCKLSIRCCFYWFFGPFVSWAVSRTVNSDEVANFDSLAEVQISKFEFPSNAKRGSRVSVMCSIMSGKAPFNFEWLKNGLPLEKNERVVLTSTEDISSLTFRQLEIQDVGNYTCIAKNREGMDAFTARLRMNCESEKNAFHFIQFISLQFLQSGPPSQLMLWKWKKDPTWTSNVWREGNRNQRLPSPKNTVGPVTCWFRRRKSVRSLTLSLTEFPRQILGYEWKKLNSFDGKYSMQVSKSDAGWYKCRAENGVEPSVENDFQLQVSGTETPFTSCCGLVLPAKGPELSSQSKWGAFWLSGIEPDNSPVWTWITWKMERLLLMALFISALESASSCEYDLFWTKNHRGFCSDRPVISRSDPVLSTTVNKKILIPCNIEEGTPPFNFEWLKDGVSIQSNENIKIRAEEDSTLSIKSTKESDAGNYTCIARDAHGSASFTTQLIIQGELGGLCDWNETNYFFQMKSTTELDTQTSGHKDNQRIVHRNNLFRHRTTESGCDMEEKPR